MYWVYVLHSAKLGRYYVGHTHDLTLRLAQHNDPLHNHNWTRVGQPWVLVASIACHDGKTARQAELLIKRMKSSKWLAELVAERMKQSRTAAFCS